MIRQDMRYDVRTQKYRMRRGEFNPAELKSVLDELPDDAAEAIETTTRFQGSMESRLPPRR